MIDMTYSTTSYSTKYLYYRYSPWIMRLSLDSCTMKVLSPAIADHPSPFVAIFLVRGVSKQTPWKSDSTLLNPRLQAVGEQLLTWRLNHNWILESYSSNSKEQHLMFTLKCSEPDYGHVLFLRPALSVPMSPAWIRIRLSRSCTRCSEIMWAQNPIVQECNL